jgi:molybdenum cofactor cytidylyltransferase
MKEKSVFALVLAAGESSRFGRTKQLENYRGTPLVTRSMQLAEAVCGQNSVLVAGNDWQRVSDICAPLAGFFVVNPRFAAGLASSIECGIRSVAEVADAVLLLLADQPLISRSHLQLLIDTWQASRESIVASAYAGISGPPVIFPRRDFADLTRLSGDSGARSIIEANEDRLKLVGFEPAALDIDRQSDLERSG